MSSSNTTWRAKVERLGAALLEKQRGTAFCIPAVFLVWARVARKETAAIQHVGPHCFTTKAAKRFEGAQKKGRSNPNVGVRKRDA